MERATLMLHRIVEGGGINYEITLLTVMIVDIYDPRTSPNGNQI